MSNSPVDQLRLRFPSAQSSIHFDHATGSPISIDVAHAMETAVAEQVRRGTEPSWIDKIEVARAEIGALIGASPDSIEFVASAAATMRTAVASVEWQPGDNLVTSEDLIADDESLRRLLGRVGVDVRLIAPDERGAIAESVVAAIDDRTSVVVTTTANSMSGWRHDLAAVASACADHAALLFADATPTLGALAIDVRSAGIDLLIADAHTWLLGPGGVGLAYRSERARSEGLNLGSSSRTPAAQNIVGIVGLAAAAQLFTKQGTRWVEDRVLALADHLANELAALGFTIVSPRFGRQRSAIIVVATPDASDTCRRLDEAGITAAAVPAGVRFSPHCYNTHDDIDAVVAALQ